MLLAPLIVYVASWSTNVYIMYTCKHVHHRMYSHAPWWVASGIQYLPLNLPCINELRKLYHQPAKGCSSSHRVSEILVMVTNGDCNMGHLILVSGIIPCTCFRECGCPKIAHVQLDTYVHITMNINGASPFFLVINGHLDLLFSVSTLYFQVYHLHQICV